MRGWPFGKDRDGAELDRELRAHLELEAEDRGESSLTPQEARYAARRDFGNVTQVKEAVYEMSPLAMAQSWLNDLRYAARCLARQPGFSAIAIVLMALGIGAASAVFSVADQALFRLLPVEDPARLRVLKWDGQFIGGATEGWNEAFSYPLFLELEEAKPAALTAIAARYQMTAALDDGARVERAEVELVSGQYFQTLGVGAALGRTLLPEDDQERDGEPWAVLTYEYWRGHFGADPAIVGRTIRLNGYPFTIIGVSQAGFRGFEALRRVDLFLSFQMAGALRPTRDHRDRRDSIWLNVFARLAAGAEDRAAASALMLPYAAILRRDIEAHPRDEQKTRTYLQNRLELADASQGLGKTREGAAAPLHILLGMVGLLLLIACVNVGSLIVIRSTKRQKEIAVRTSLGASRFAVMRLVLLECLLLSAAGAALGLLVARVGVELLVPMIQGGRIGLEFETSLDWRILAFSAALAVLTALFFGLAPALQATRAVSATALKDEAASVSLGRSQMRVRRILVVAQVGLSLLLLAVAGLFGKSLGNVFDVDTGMDVDRLLSFAVNPSEQRYEPARSLRFAVEMQRRLERTPGVRSASAADTPILRGANGQNTIQVEGYEASAGESMQAGANSVLPGFFSTLGIGLLSGRDFTERDATGAPKVLIVNETFAKRFFDSPAKAVGKRVGSFLDKAPLPFEIVGVVKDHKGTDLKEEPRPRTYYSLLQQQTPAHLFFYLHTRGAPEALSSAALQGVREVDPALAVFDLSTVKRQAEVTHFIERLFARLSATFAALATLIAAVGLYGVAAFSVTRRTREIGVRMALGAQRDGIFALVLREALGLAVAGALIGAPLALAAGKMVEAQLYGVSAIDLGICAAAVAVMLAAASLAGYFPARRAMRISPVSALRHE